MDKYNKVGTIIIVASCILLGVVLIFSTYGKQNNDITQIVGFGFILLSIGLYALIKNARKADQKEKNKIIEKEFNRRQKLN